MSSKIHNSEFSLKEISKNIETGKYTIPKFQRDFVWKVPDIENLGDSIIRGYPISSMLTMPENGTLKIMSTQLKTYGTNINNDIKNYVLDGQQRLTSIAKIFVNCDDQKEYYFDLMAMLVEKFPNDNILDFDYIKNKPKNYPKITEYFCRSFKISKNKDEKITRHDNRFISGRSIIYGKFGSTVSKFLRNLKISEGVFCGANEDKIDNYTDYLNEVLGAVSSYGIPFTIISADANLDVVCRVFEKVNTSGKNLSIFDLINAKSFGTKEDKYKMGLIEYLTNDITNYIKSHKNIEGCFNEFLNYNPSSKAFLDIGRLVKIMASYEILKKDNVPSYTNAGMLSKEPEFWFKTWDKVKNDVMKCIVLFGEEDLFEIGSISFMEYIISVMVANPHTIDCQRFRDSVYKNSLYFSLSQNSFSRTNIGLIMKFHDFAKDLKNKIKFDVYNLSSEPVISLKFDVKSIKDYKKGQKPYKAAMKLMIDSKYKGKFTRDICDVRVNKLKSQKMDEHHLIPRAYTKNKDNPIFDSLANITLLNTHGNRNVIKDTSFVEYMKKLEGKFGKNKHLDLLGENLIPSDFDNFYDNNEFNEIKFLEERAKLITEHINEILSK